MTEVIAGGSVALLSLWYAYDGGPLTNLDATPSITITNVGTGATALSSTTSGVSNLSTGAYGYNWSPSSSLAAGTYLASWSGLMSGAAVNATEVITVHAGSAGTTPVDAWDLSYCTREDVAYALDAAATYRSNEQIDRIRLSVSRAIESPKQLGRYFYPTLATRYVDWPTGRRDPSYRVWLDSSRELISLSSVTSGGSSISTAYVHLEPSAAGPPYTRLDLDRSTSAAFSYSGTGQRSLALTGVFGGCPIIERTQGTIAEALDDSETAVDVSSGSVGVGALIRVDAERMIVVGKQLLTTGVTTSGALTAVKNGTSVAVSSGTGFAAGELIVIDSETMYVTAVNGNTLTVVRAWEGSTLAAHNSGTTVYAYRTLLVRRGVLGTTAAAHSTSTTLYRFEFPSLVRSLAIAESLVQLGAETSQYARVIGTSDSQREARGFGLADIRAQARATHGRNAPRVAFI